jgi:hypothetical protein
VLPVAGIRACKPHHDDSACRNDTGIRLYQTALGRRELQRYAGRSVPEPAGMKMAGFFSPDFCDVLHHGALWISSLFVEKS